MFGMPGQITEITPGQTISLLFCEVYPKLNGLESCYRASAAAALTLAIAITGIVKLRANSERKVKTRP